MNADKVEGGILNLTQHQATTEQVAEGVYEPVTAVKMEVQHLLTFDEIPFREEVIRRARRLAEIAKQTPCSAAMIGGAPFLMSELERELAYAGVTAVYAFTRREAVETQQPDGSIRKTSKFLHLGFYVADGEIGGSLLSD